MPWYRVARCEELAASQGLRVQTPGADLAVFWADGRPVAIDDACLRCCASLASSTLNGGSRVVCCKCGWEYDVFTGAFTALPKLRLDVYKVKIADACIYALTNAAPEVPDASTWMTDPQRASGGS
jgi:nitrite reductase/ring-hydroxylating ferredoxin subunit